MKAYFDMRCCYFFHQGEAEDEAEFVNCKEAERTWLPDNIEHRINQNEG